MIKQRFRRVWRFLTPPFLQGGDGSRLLFSFGYLIDAFVEHARQGLISRLPTMASPSANTLTAGDRGILRGRTEPQAHFAERLTSWRYPRGHRVRGNAWEVLEQIWHHFAVHNSTVALADSEGRSSVRVLTIDRRGQQWTKEADGGDPVRTLPGGWNWDGADASEWARFWVVLHQTPPSGEEFFELQPDIGDDELWGGGYGVPGYTIGVGGLLPSDVLVLRELFQDRNWHPCGTVPEWCVISFDGNSPSPDGTWERWGKDDGGGTWVAARDLDYRYVSLTPTVNNTDRSDPDSFPVAAPLVDGSFGFYEGNEELFPTSAARPQGSGTYVGDPDQFPINVILLDDGSIPR